MERVITIQEQRQFLKFINNPNAEMNEEEQRQQIELQRILNEGQELTTNNLDIRLFGNDMLCRSYDRPFVCAKIHVSRLCLTIYPEVTQFLDLLVQE
jgi:hypothetical protein